MSENPIPKSALLRALSLRDLTDPDQGPHAMQTVMSAIVSALRSEWGCPVRERRASPVVRAEDNYDHLGYPPDAAARDARYTRWVGPGILLRAHTSAMIPPALGELAAAPVDDVLIVCPGLVYRRDQIDRLHTGEPHQLDLWRVRRHARLDADDLRAMVARVVEAALPGAEHRVTDADHPYTAGGLQIDAHVDGAWVEIGECGLADPGLLRRRGLSPDAWSGLAMGLGLDRLLMLRKGIPDIRLLRSEDPRVARQMTDLAPWRSVSKHPPVRRDLSIVTRGSTDAEELGDRVRAALGERASAVEAVEVLAATPCEELPATARRRLAIEPGQTNVLLRIVLRDLRRTLTHAEANELRDDVYAAVHEGTRWEWAGRHRGAKDGPGD